MFAVFLRVEGLAPREDGEGFYKVLAQQDADPAAQAHCYGTAVKRGPTACLIPEALSRNAGSFPLLAADGCTDHRA